MAYNIEAKLHVLKNGGERVTSAYGNRTIYINGAYNTNFHSGIDLVQRSPAPITLSPPRRAS